MTSRAVDTAQIDLSSIPQAPFSRPLDFRVACSLEAYETVCKHARESLGLEICGVLIGEVYQDENGPFVEVSAAIRGEHAAHQAAQVTFTHETWAHISNVKDAEFAEQRIVGWYHSHPGFGVFLSPQDVFIHRGFFDLPWQIALVVDPRSAEEGFFVWRDGEPRLVEQYWIGTTRRSNRLVAPDLATGPKIVADVTTGKPSAEKSRQVWGPGLSIAALLAIALLGTILIRMELHFAELGKGRDAPAATVAEPTPPAPLPDLRAARDSLARHGIGLGAEAAVRLGSGVFAWCSGTVSTFYQKELLAAVLAASQGVDAVDVRQVAVIHEYVVRPNDSLTEIARKVYGKPGNWTLIYQANRSQINDPRLIFPAMKLIIPEAVAEH